MFSQSIDLSEKEISRRKNLWWALSDFWLDTEADDDTYNYIVREMIDSGFSLEEIEEIYACEVAPVVYGNLYGGIGEWGAFNRERLNNDILENLKKQKDSFIYRTWVRSNLGKFMMTKMVQDDWRKVVKIYSRAKL